MQTLKMIFFAIPIMVISCSQQERNDYRGTSLKKVDSLADKMEADSGKLTVQDRQFVTATALDGMTEIEAGKLAKQKSADTAIQSFGSLLITQHQQLVKDLKTMLNYRDIKLPTSLDKSHQDKIDALSSKSGREFNRVFLQQMIEDHKNAVNMFNEAGGHAKDVQIQAFANKNLPIIKNHLQIANELNRNNK